MKEVRREVTVPAQGWKVGVAYERYGYIHVDASEAKTEEEAVVVAQKKLEGMSFEDLEKITGPLADSEEIDREGVITL